MSTLKVIPKNTETEKRLTASIRGRVEPTVKARAAALGKKLERNESYVVRRAVTEYLDRNEKKAA